MYLLKDALSLVYAEDNERDHIIFWLWVRANDLPNVISCFKAQLSIIDDDIQAFFFRFNLRYN